MVQKSITEQTRGMKTMSSVKKRCEGCKVRLGPHFDVSFLPSEVEIASGREKKGLDRNWELRIRAWWNVFGDWKEP